MKGCLRNSVLRERAVVPVGASLVMTLSAMVCFAESSTPSSLSQITGVQRVSLRRSERIVVHLDRNTSIRQGCLSKPNRVYFDFARARRSSNLKINNIGGSRQLHRVRFGVHRHSVRIVLDLKHSARLVVFKAVDPSRLIVDFEPSKTSTAAFCRGGIPDRAVPEGEIPRIVIDPGHGGGDQGGIGPSGPTEASLALKVSKHLARLLQERLGADVIVTRGRDASVSLLQRAEITNRTHPDLFVSLHADARPLSPPCGPRTYYLKLTNSPSVLRIAERENVTSNRKIFELTNLLTSILEDRHTRKSRALARSVAEAYSNMSATSLLDTNSIVAGGPFIVLLGVNTPAVIVSLGCIRSPVEEQLLGRLSQQEALSRAIFLGIRSFLRASLSTRPGARQK